MKASAFALYATLILNSTALVAKIIKSEIHGLDIVPSKIVDVKTGSKGLVVTFVSAECPCSHSHVDELKSLAESYPDFNFVGVHSNTDESKEVTIKYFKDAAFSFPIIQDTGAKIADEFKAYKTPHTFVLSPTGETLYKGGVTDSKDCQRADRKYLREALADINQGQKVKTPEGRTLGCAIARGGKYDW